MTEQPVELRVGGQTYRVRSSAPAPDLLRAADLVDQRLRDIVGTGRPVSSQQMLLVALTLADDITRERERRQSYEQRARRSLGALLERVDRALEDTASVMAAPGTPPQIGR